MDTSEIETSERRALETIVFNDSGEGETLTEVFLRTNVYNRLRGIDRGKVPHGVNQG